MKYYRNFMNVWGFWGYGLFLKGLVFIFIFVCFFVLKCKGFILRNIYIFFFVEDVLLRWINVLCDIVEMKNEWFCLNNLLKEK